VEITTLVAGCCQLFRTDINTDNAARRIWVICKSLHEMTGTTSNIQNAVISSGLQCLNDRLATRNAFSTFRYFSLPAPDVSGEVHDALDPCN
jgi:hypothetical protein